MKPSRLWPIGIAAIASVGLFAEEQPDTRIGRMSSRSECWDEASLAVGKPRFEGIHRHVVQPG
jgi:hypothetical protein